MPKEKRQVTKEEEMENKESKQTIEVKWSCSICNNTFTSDKRDYAFETEMHLINHKDNFITKIE